MIRLLGVHVMVLSLVFAAAGALTAQENAPPAATARAASTLVNLNTATPAQIATLPGIGPKMAQLIVEHREKTGGFKKVEELMQVKGIGEKSFLKLKELVTVGDGKVARQ